MADAKPIGDLAPERSLGFQVRRCHRAFDRVLNGHLASESLTSGFWYFLRALWQEDGATQKRLAQLNNVTEPTAVTMLASMDRLPVMSGSCDFLVAHGDSERILRLDDRVLVDALGVHRCRR